MPAAQPLRVGRRRDRGAVGADRHGDAALVVGAAQRRRRARAPEHGAAANADDERVAGVRGGEEAHAAANEWHERP